MLFVWIDARSSRSPLHLACITYHIYEAREKLLNSQVFSQHVPRSSHVGLCFAGVAFTLNGMNVLSRTLPIASR